MWCGGSALLSAAASRRGDDREATEAERAGTDPERDRGDLATGRGQRGASAASAALQGARIGYLPSMVGSNSATAGLFTQARATLEAQGATVVELTAPTGFSAVLNEGSGSTNEFLHDLNIYVENHLSPDVAQRTLQQIMDGGNYVTSRRSVYQQRNAVTDATYQAWAGPTGSHTLQLAAGKTLVTQLMDDNDLDAIIYPSTNAYGTIGTNMRLSPNTGMPAVTLPMGTTGAGQGGAAVGVNLEWLGRDFSEGVLLGLAYDFEQATHYRTTPTLYPALG
ncbi:hypothetical protein [Microbacterium aurum]|nr:hypothetical protein [Microbacterium aurum]